MTRSEFFQSVYRVEKDLAIGAIHEAGHCVAAWVFDFPILEMSIDEFRQDRDGFFNMSSAYEVSADRLNNHHARTKYLMAVIAMAGIMAERRISGILDDAALEGDAEKTLKHIGKFFTNETVGEDMLEDVLDEVDEILDDHWAKVEMLAIAAYKFGPVLDGPTVKEIIDRS